MKMMFSLNTLYANGVVDCDKSTLLTYGNCNASQDNLGYVYVSKGDGSKAVRLHSLLLPEAEMVDHIDRNPANNCINNLRYCTKAENTINSKLREDNTSGYRGVSYHKATKSWQARISIVRKGKNVRLNLGLYLTADSAALVYNTFARKYHGEFAYINEVKNK
jgi:hypothetical protein